jgi:hypothetical protein
MISKFHFFLFVPLLFLPVVSVFANPATETGGNVEVQESGGNTLNPQSVETVCLENPLRIGTLEELLVAILNIIMVLMVPVIVFFIIYAGFLYVTARGNAEQVKKATTALTYAVIGAVLILGSVAISEIIKNTVAEFGADTTSLNLGEAQPCP